MCIRDRANTIISLVGEPIFALGVGTIIAIYGLVRKEDNKKVIGIMDTAIKDTGIILSLIHIYIIAIGAGNDFIHHHFCETVMLKFRINGEVDDMKSSGFMKLGGPSGVEVIFAEDKVEKCLHSRILVEQPAVCDEAFFQADKIIIKCMTVIG